MTVAQSLQSDISSKACPAGVRLDAFCSSGPSPTTLTCTDAGTSLRPLSTKPTLHLIGPGHVGRALLKIIDQSRYRLVAVTDTTATRWRPSGLDPLEIIETKRCFRALSAVPQAIPLSVDEAIEQVAADVVIDATATRFDRPTWIPTLQRTVLNRGTRLVMAAKDGICYAAERWFQDRYRRQVGIAAVLGGTGRSLQEELPELRGCTRRVALAGNASTTAIISALERGSDFDQSLAEARGFGYLEADPELDLRGTDATVKLAIVAGALLERAVDPAEIVSEDIRDIDVDAIRWRAAHGQTTRLVGRLEPDGELRVGYEALPRWSPLAVPCSRVVYTYHLRDQRVRVHAGQGVGWGPTAQALWSDVQNLCDGGAK